MKTNKKRILTAIIFTFFLLITGTTQTQAEAQIINIKINGGGVTNNKAYIKTEINGHKITIRTPKLTKNKYLKLVNIGI